MRIHLGLAGSGGVLALVACTVPVLVVLVLAAANAGVREAAIAAMPLLLRYSATLVLPGLALWASIRTLKGGMAAASVLAVVNLLAFAAFAGVAQTAAICLVLGASALLGSWLMNMQTEAGDDLLASVIVGVAILVALAGWLLPLPVHGVGSYLAVAGLIFLGGWRRLAALSRLAGARWSSAVQGHPVAACFAVSTVGLAAVLTWMPSLNPDDNSAHLLLAKQLLTDSYYRLDVSSQLFAVAPWFNNVFHALSAVLSGDEARPVVGLFWLLLGASGAYRLAVVLGAGGAYPWLATALYASHPLTAYFGMTLQVDGASAAVLMHLVTGCVELRAGALSSRWPWLLGALFGTLAALKITNLVYAGILGVWLIWHGATSRRLTGVLATVGVATLIAGSSYFYAILVTGNPVAPLFNGVFKSPYFPIADFQDPRWHVGVHLNTLWEVTFATPRYMESYVGAAGFALLALVGAWAVGIAEGGKRAILVLFGFIAGGIVFWQVQYLRYIFPVFGLLGTVAVVTMSGLRHQRIAAWALVVLALAQVSMLRTTSWILAAGGADRLLAEGPREVAHVERDFVPEKAIVRELDAGGSAYCLLFADMQTSYVALAPGRSMVTGFYDTRMSAEAQRAATDATGAAWLALIDGIGFTHVLLRPSQMPAGLALALEKGGFTAVRQTGEAQLWYRAETTADKCIRRTLDPRNEARRLLARTGLALN